MRPNYLIIDNFEKAICDYFYFIKQQTNDNDYHASWKSLIITGIDGILNRGLKLKDIKRVGHHDIMHHKVISLGHLLKSYAKFYDGFSEGSTMKVYEPDNNQGSDDCFDIEIKDYISTLNLIGDYLIHIDTFELHQILKG